jgi:hypothetical protein
VLFRSDVDAGSIEIDPLELRGKRYFMLRYNADFRAPLGSNGGGAHGASPLATWIDAAGAEARALHSPKRDHVAGTRVTNDVGAFLRNQANGRAQGTNEGSVSSTHCVSPLLLQTARDTKLLPVVQLRSGVIVLMGNMRYTIFIGLALAAWLPACAVGNGGDGWVSCGRNARFQLEDLGMSPDPVAAGDRVERFRVTLRSDGPADCETRVQIRETQGGDLIGRETKPRLRRGVNRFNIEPDSRYRFSRQEHCFVVVVDREGNWSPVDAVRRFCARQINGKRWTLKS